MQRSQFIAILVIAIVGIGLLAAKFGSSSDAAELATGPDQSQQAGPEDNDTGGASNGTSETADGTQNGPEPGADSAEEDVGSSGVAGEQASTGADTTVAAAEPLPILDDKPPLTDLDGWLNTEATSLDDFAGQVRVVEFWTFGCFNCKNRLPHTQELYARWQPEGLEIVGVHAPEFDFERDPEAVAAAAADLGVTWPVALDTEKTNFRAWQGNRRFWPRVFVLDQNGDVRYDHIGEGDYDGLEAVVANLIENGP